MTLNIPTKNGMAHQIIGDHPAASIQELKKSLMEEDFILVEEYQQKFKDGPLMNEGLLLINHHYVGKVRVYNPK
jgi:hypothetical protein